MIVVRNLVKHYGSHVAVSDLSFEVEAGKVVGFLGPNGAGKSTTLRILAGFLGKTAGEVTIAGHPVDTYDAKRATGYMPEAVPLYPEMRVIEYLRFRAELKEVPRKDRASFIDNAMERANVTDVATRTIGALSKGYRQRVGLADALVSKPPLLILDEPTAGLDPNQMREVRSVIKSLGKEHTVLLSTHILSEVEASCDEVIVIAKGKLVASGTTSDIQKKRRAPGVALVVRAEKSEVARVLSSVTFAEPGSKSGGGAATGAKATGASGGNGFAKVDITPEGELLRVVAKFKKGTTETGPIIEQTVAALVAAKIQIRAVSLIQSTLEDVFAELTKNSPPGGAESNASRRSDVERAIDGDSTDDAETSSDLDANAEPDSSSNAGSGTDSDNDSDPDSDVDSNPKSPADRADRSDRSDRSEPSEGDA